MAIGPTGSAHSSHTQIPLCYHPKSTLLPQQTHHAHDVGDEGWPSEQSSFWVLGDEDLLVVCPWYSCFGAGVKTRGFIWQAHNYEVWCRATTGLGAIDSRVSFTYSTSLVWSLCSLFLTSCPSSRSWGNVLQDYGPAAASPATIISSWCQSVANQPQCCALSTTLRA